MKKFFFTFLAASSLFYNGVLAQAPKASVNAAAAKPVAARQDFQVPFVNKTLANGLEVIVLPDPSVPIVTVELVVRNGSFTESPEFHGLSHLYEHMFFKPNYAIRLRSCESASNRITTATSPQCSAAFALKSKIGDVSYLNDAGQVNMYNGSTREEMVNYFYNTTSNYLGTAMRIVNDSVRFPSFDESDFENEKRVVIGEIDRHESNPYQYLDLTMKGKLFFKHPTRKNPSGTRESVGSATTDKMRTIKARYYVPNNSALVVTGDAKPDEVFKLAEQIFGSWEKRPIDPFKEFPLVEHPPLPKSEGVVLEQTIGEDVGEGQGRNVIIEIGWHGPSIGKDDAATYAADVFSYIITQPNSRFQRNLIDSGLTASASFGYYTQRNVGPIQSVLITSPEKSKDALKAFYKEVANFTRPDYFTDEELESAKTILESTDLFDREKPSEYAHTLGFWWSSTGIDYFRDYHKKLRAVSRADINRYITNYIQRKNHVGIALLSSDAQKQANLTEQDLIGGK